MTRDAIRSIQTGLAALGHSPGEADGLFGQNTRAATERWLAAGGRAAPTPAAPKPTTSAMIYQGNARYPVREITVHCAATRPGWMAGQPLADKVAEIRRWHMAAPNHWKGIGYHWIIDRDGKVLPGRAENVIGAGVVGHNNGVIHVCLLGGHGSAETDQFPEHFTYSQDVTLRQMIDAISARTQIERISGHNEKAAKACPGFNVPKWLRLSPRPA